MLICCPKAAAFKKSKRTIRDFFASVISGIETKIGLVFEMKVA
jgi:hypothetical protein